MPDRSKQGSLNLIAVKNPIVIQMPDIRVYRNNRYTGILGDLVQGLLHQLERVVLFDFKAAYKYSVFEISRMLLSKTQMIPAQAGKRIDSPEKKKPARSGLLLTRGWLIELPSI
jgi:hypothetical protein